MHSLDSYFASHAVHVLNPPAPGAQQENCAAPADAQEAVAQLGRLLTEFSGEATDYFESVRAQLAAVLAPQVLARLEQHLSRYEFEEAHQLLPQAAASPPDTAETS
jgi:hypothetical protein